MVTSQRNMSFLANEIDAQATLRDALAFIDAWDAEEEDSELDVSSASPSAVSSSYSSGSDSTGDSSSSSPSASSRSASSPPPQQDQQLPSSLRFRIVLPPPAGADSGLASGGEARGKRNDAWHSGTAKVAAAASKRKGNRTPMTKDEIAVLRDQASRLEAQLRLLQERSVRTNRLVEQSTSGREGSGGSIREPPVAGSGGTWRTAGSLGVELERVQRSLKRNRELKDALAKQLQISRALKKLVQSKRVQHGLALLSEEPSHLEIAPLRSFQNYVEDPTLVFAELYSNVKSKHLEARAISHGIQSSCDLSNVHLSSAITHDDATSCAKLEITTTAPVAYNFRRLGRLLWSQIATPNDCIETGQYFTHAQSTASDTYERCFNMTHSSPQGDLSFRGATVMRISDEEPHRMVIAHTSLFVETDSGTVFRESSWFILTDLINSTTTSSSSSNSSSPPKTLFQTFYRLTTDLKQHEDAQVRAMQQFVLKSMSVMMRNNLQQVQNMVTADAEVVPLLVLTNKSCISVKCLT